METDDDDGFRALRGRFGSDGGKRLPGRIFVRYDDNLVAQGGIRSAHENVEARLIGLMHGEVQDVFAEDADPVLHGFTRRR